MFSLKKISSLALSLQTRPVYLFSKDGWKDRDEASEKVYISQAESKFWYYFRGNYQEIIEESLGGRGRSGVKSRIIRSKTSPNHAQI